MRRHVFVRIMNAVEEHDDYFIQKMNTASTLGLSCLQKVAPAFQMIANGVAADATNEYVRVGENTTLECLRKFAIVVVEVFGGTTHRRCKSTPPSSPCLPSPTKRSMMNCCDRLRATP
jgi:hypothetical protein